MCILFVSFRRKKFKCWFKCSIKTPKSKPKRKYSHNKHDKIIFFFFSFSFPDKYVKSNSSAYGWTSVSIWVTQGHTAWPPAAAPKGHKLLTTVPHLSALWRPQRLLWMFSVTLDIHIFVPELSPYSKKTMTRKTVLITSEKNKMKSILEEVEISPSNNFQMLEQNPWGDSKIQCWNQLYVVS